jgi:hypothetical protein
MSAPFGTPAAIVGARLRTMQPHMQHEAALMLLDMGFSPARAGAHLGLPAPAFDRLVACAPMPFRRGGEMTLAGDCE